VEEVLTMDEEVSGSVDNVTPSYVIEMGEEAAKPLPVSVTLESTDPLLGESDIEGVKTVKGTTDTMVEP